MVINGPERRASHDKVPRKLHPNAPIYSVPQVLQDKASYDVLETEIPAVLPAPHRAIGPCAGAPAARIVDCHHSAKALNRSAGGRRATELRSCQPRGGHPWISAPSCSSPRLSDDH